MSTGTAASAPLCQGFLKKRKDKMKLRWVTYWFRLHNTTLFFYTKKLGSALDLRGQYYIHEFQAVREVSKSENNRYLFEIIMKNGKRKLLSADSAHVRQEWTHQLWKAMLLLNQDRSGPALSGEAVDDLQPDAQSSFMKESSADTSITSMENRSFSIGQESNQSFSDADETVESLQIDTEMEQSTEEILLMDNEYDVLPPPRKDSKEAIYNTPTSKISTNEKQQDLNDSIYDVPNSLVKKMTETHGLSESPESGGLLSDMISCLDYESAVWVKTAPP